VRISRESTGLKKRKRTMSKKKAFKKNRNLKVPERTKYKYTHFRLERKGQKGLSVVGKMGIAVKAKIKKPVFLTPRQIEVLRRFLYSKAKKGRARMYIRVFPDLPLSKKPQGLRMGAGKGRNHNAWLARIKNGQPLVEFIGRGLRGQPGFSREHIERALVQLQFRMPFLIKARTRYTKRSIWGHRISGTEINKKSKDEEKV
jgi:large subunit ribosomal protein L16